MRYSRVGYSGVCFPIFYCNLAGLSNVVRYDRVFVIARFVSRVPLYMQLRHVSAKLLFLVFM